MAILQQPRTQLNRQRPGTGHSTRPDAATQSFRNADSERVRVDMTNAPPHAQIGHFGVMRASFFIVEDRALGRYDARVDESLARAFPARLAPVVMNVLQMLPGTRLGPVRPVTRSNSRSWPGLVVSGEPVVIPYRVYNPEPSPRALDRLGQVEAVVTAAIHSRHDDGFVRQRQLGMLLGSDEPWTAPFIVQLLGEYVIEICFAIERFARTAFPARSAMQDSMSAFFRDNHCFAELTRQRAASYWSCYHRGLYGSRVTCPALASLSILSSGTIA
jgi:hypothetical protein